MAEKGFFTNVAHITTLVGLAAAILGFYWKLETEIKAVVTDSTIVISKELQTKTESIVDMHRDDLKIRIRILNSEIKSYETNNTPVPERLRINLEALNDQVEELDSKWAKH